MYNKMFTYPNIFCSPLHFFKNLRTCLLKHSAINNVGHLNLTLPIADARVYFHKRKENRLVCVVACGRPDPVQTNTAVLKETPQISLLSLGITPNPRWTQLTSAKEFLNSPSRPQRRYISYATFLCKLYTVTFHSNSCFSFTNTHDYPTFQCVHESNFNSISLK